MSDNFFAASESSKENQPAVIIKEIIAKYLKYLPWIVLCAILGGILAYIKVRYIVPQYSAHSSLLIQGNNAMSAVAGGSDNKLGSLFMAGGSINLSNEIQILQSRPLLRRVAKNLSLNTKYYAVGNVKSTLFYNNSPLKLVILDSWPESDGFSMEIQAKDNQTFTIGSNVIYTFNQPFSYNNHRFQLFRIGEISKTDNGYQKILITYSPLEDVAGGLKGAFSAKPIEGTNILDLSVVTENQDLCKDIVTNIMAVYDSMSIEDKSKLAQITLQFIDDRLDTVKSDLSGVERKLQDFMESSGLYDIDAQASNYLSIYNKSFDQQTEMNIQQSILAWLVNYLKQPQNRNKMVPTSLGIKEPSLTGYVEGYNKMQLEREAALKTTPESNPIIQKMDVSLEKMRVDMIEALNNVKASYNITDNSVKATTQKAQNELQSMPLKARQMLEIKRRQQIMQDLYTFLLQKKIEVSISSASTISISRVVESAVGSGLPVAPNTRSIYMMYILAGLLIPVGIAVGIEVLSDRIYSKADIQKITQTPIVGEVGHSNPEDLPLVVKNNSRKFVAEQFRIIRTNLQYVLNKVEKPVIIVTSTFSGEGKSFISTNIGGVIALSGKRTLIMEFDIRKPKVASGLGVHTRKGITNYIVGNASLDELIVPIKDIPGLFVLPCGPVPPNPAELILSSGINDLFKYARENFDAVVVDTAPVGMVSDAQVLAEYADGALYIVRQGYTYKRQVEFIEDLYQKKKLPRQAIVINDIKKVRGYGSYYGYGYGYGYGLGNKNKNHYFEDTNMSFWEKIWQKINRKQKAN